MPQEVQPRDCLCSVVARATPHKLEGCIPSTWRSAVRSWLLLREAKRPAAWRVGPRILGSVVLTGLGLRFEKGN